jgi:hypothetical protein
MLSSWPPEPDTTQCLLHSSSFNTSISALRNFHDLCLAFASVFYLSRSVSGKGMSSRDRPRLNCFVTNTWGLYCDNHPVKLPCENILLQVQQPCCCLIIFMVWFIAIVSRSLMYVRVKDAVSRAENITTRAFNHCTLEFVTISKTLRVALKSRQAVVEQINAPKALLAVYRSVWRAKGCQTETRSWECSLSGMCKHHSFMCSIDGSSRAHPATLAIEWYLQLFRCTVQAACNYYSILEVYLL